MPPSILEITTDLVLAQIQAGNISPEEVSNAIRRIYQNLLTLKSREEAGLTVPAPGAETPRAPPDWRQSITRQTITCLECGAILKQLNGHHLRIHGLNARTYRDKYGIPHSQPLAARATTAKRRQIVAAVKPWEKSPTYRKGQEAKAAAAKKSRMKGTRRR